MDDKISRISRSVMSAGHTSVLIDLLQPLVRLVQTAS
jgi:hypothetical protein